MNPSPSSSGLQQWRVQTGEERGGALNSCRPSIPAMKPLGRLPQRQACFGVLAFHGAQAPESLSQSVVSFDLHRCRSRLEVTQPWR